jgi:exodeoxyribonuclease VIII
MNVSKLVHGLESMRHLKWEIDHPTEATPAMKRGTMAHTYILQPEEFRSRYVRMPEFQFDRENSTGKGQPSVSKATTYYKERVAAFEAENSGSEVITGDDIAWCESIKLAVRSDPTALKLLESCKWEDPLFGSIEGVECKGLLDLLSQCWIGDIKTAMSVQPRMFGSSAAKLNYPFKLSFYRELARQNGYPIDTVFLIAVESKGPFDCVTSEVPEIVLDNAFGNVCRVMRDYKRCLETGVWPGVSGGRVQQLEIPLWSMPDEEPTEYENVA